MKGVPQVYQINPAFQPGCKFFIGLPGISPIQVRVQNEPLVLKDILSYNESLEQLITFLHPLGDQAAFLNALNDRNFINADAGVPIASIGFGSPSKGSFVGFDITQKVSTSFNYPKDLMRFALEGPDEASFFDFNGFGVDALVYTELAMNVSRKIGEKLTFGWRGKILVGQANVSTSKFDVTMNTGQTAWQVHSNIIMDAALPFLDMKIDNGVIDLENIELMQDIEKKYMDLAFNPKNIGLAMDIGVDFKPIEWLQISASIVDFGSIKWKDKVYNMENDADYAFNGLEFGIDDFDNAEGLLDDLADSLSQSFEFIATENSYRTQLPTKLYAGAAFYVHPKISFGVLSRSEFYKKKVRQQFTFSANLYPIRMISTTFSYSIIEGLYKNLGVGLALKALPFNFYIISDTAPSVYFWPTEAMYINLRVGMNIMFGCRQKKAAKYDMPLIK